MSFHTNLISFKARMLFMFMATSCMFLDLIFIAHATTWLEKPIYEKQVSSVTKLLELKFRLEIPIELIDQMRNGRMVCYSGGVAQ